ncbi:hypothetical protein HHL14_31025 [Paraburkholderia sp. G-4-1-8]|uniref:Pirin C-terminal domain-containing protein n=1 Tax=Paraburkholderia antibiotica TaxID=2728839 RepID=A0A7Y0A2E9_9BURK|nr:hypothetical protein [Paraburkholderia antibiotica]
MATVKLDASLEMGLYVVEGEASVQDLRLETGMLGLLGDGSQVSVAARGGEAVELVLIGGLPVQGDVLFSGPFVMNTHEQLAQGRRDFAEGRMGTLDGVPF